MRLRLDSFRLREDVVEVRLGLVKRVDVFALKILDDLRLARLLIGHRHNVRRNTRAAGEVSRP